MAQKISASSFAAGRAGCRLSFVVVVVQYLLLQKFAIKIDFKTVTQSVIDALRKHQFRVTPQREMMGDVLLSAGKHMAGEEIYGPVKKRTSAVNIVTMYRTLDLLVEQGFVNRMHRETG